MYVQYHPRLISAEINQALQQVLIAWSLPRCRKKALSVKTTKRTGHPFDLDDAMTEDVPGDLSLSEKVSALLAARCAQEDDRTPHGVIFLLGVIDG